MAYSPEISVTEQIKIALLNLSLTNYEKYRNLYYISLSSEKYKLYCEENKLDSTHDCHLVSGNSRTYVVYDNSLFPPQFINDKKNLYIN